VLRVLARLAGRLPVGVLRAALRAVLGERRLALCLHRVGEAPGSAAVCTIPASRLDRLIELLLGSRDDAAHWLTVSFDDGYEDARGYVASRAPRYPQVEFLFFVCPEKTERGAGFRWDAETEAALAGRAAEPFEPLGDVRRENEHQGLRGLGLREPYRLADLEAVRELARLPNVAIGNHTNGHLRPVTLSDAQAGVEYQRSREDFRRLFGEPRHFAFPFGTPWFDVEPRHARIAASLGTEVLWSTEGRPYEPSERRAGAVLPRFPVDGSMGHREIAALIVLRSLVHRLSRRRRFSA
jgi:peptidoglycan/xylan/chitin deacetylase (PgdA/CDA1 family)